MKVVKNNNFSYFMVIDNRIYIAKYNIYTLNDNFRNICEWRNEDKLTANSIAIEWNSNGKSYEFFSLANSLEVQLKGNCFP